MENVTPPLKRNETKPGNSRFGRTQVSLVWIERGGLRDIAASLKADPELALDWLEHLTVMSMDDLLVATYFLRSFVAPTKRLVLRTTVAAGKSAALPSVRGTWPMAVPMETEITERFGIRFFTTEAEAG